MSDPKSFLAKALKEYELEHGATGIDIDAVEKSSGATLEIAKDSLQKLMESRAEFERRAESFTDQSLKAAVREGKL